jgi:hypothetical protein
MITEIVLFNLPAGTTRAQAVDRFRKTAPIWAANTELVRKNYLFDANGPRAGGVYLWPSVEAAKRAHDEAWLAGVEKAFGNRPVITYFETPVVVDNALGQVIEETPAEEAA